jgi:hypothetical protein
MLLGSLSNISKTSVKYVPNGPSIERGNLTCPTPNGKNSTASGSGLSASRLIGLDSLHLEAAVFAASQSGYVNPNNWPAANWIATYPFARWSSVTIVWG